MRSLLFLLVTCSVLDAAPQDRVPAPEANAAHEDVPRGATCRIGSARLASNRDYGEIVYPSLDRIYLEGLGSWQVDNAKTGAQLEEYKLGVVTAGVSPSGTCVAVTQMGKTDIDTIELFTFPAKKSVVKASFVTDSDGFVPSDNCRMGMQPQRHGGCVALFDANVMNSGSVCSGIELRAAAMSGDGRRVALAPSRMTEKEYVGDGIHVFDTATRNQVAFVKRTGAYVGMVTLSRDGGALAFVDGAVVRIVRGATTTTVTVPKDADVRALAFSHNTKRLAISIGNDPATLIVADVATGTPVITQSNLPGLASATFSSDDTRLAYNTSSGARIIDVATGSDVVAAGRLFRIKSSAIDPSGDRAVVSSMAHLSVWDTHACSRTADFANEPVLTKLWAPNPTTALGLAVGEDAALVRVDLGTGKRVGVSLAPVRTVDSLVPSPDGKLAAVGLEAHDSEQQVVIVDVATMKVLRRVTLPKVGPIGALAFTENSKHVYAVAAGGVDNGDSPTGGSSVIELDTATGATVSHFQIPWASQWYKATLLEHDRLIAINAQLFVRATGKVVPDDAETAPTPVVQSADGVTVLWADHSERSLFRWPTSDPVPAKPHVLPRIANQFAVGKSATLACDDQSCVVIR